MRPSSRGRGGSSHGRTVVRLPPRAERLRGLDVSCMFRAMPLPALGDLLGQPDVSEFLRGVVARGRYANAYLFHGPAGVGKGTAALAFARAMLCERAAGAML